jgi:hypothetical protein
LFAEHCLLLLLGPETRQVHGAHLLSEISMSGVVTGMEDVLVRLETWRPVYSFRVKDESGLICIIFGRFSCIIFSFIIVIDGIIGDNALDAVFRV